MVARLNGRHRKALALPDVKTKFEAAGGLAIGSTPEQLGGRIAQEFNNWGVIVKEANIKVE